jgi:hypothetical protein
MLNNLKLENIKPMATIPVSEAEVGSTVFTTLRPAGGISIHYVLLR